MALGTYQYGVRLNSEGSPTAFGAAVDTVRINPEVHPALRSQPSQPASQHGEVVVARGFYKAYNFVLEVDLSYGNPEQASTVYANKGTILERLTHPYEQVWLTRTAPDQGAVEIPIIVLREPVTSTPRHRLRIPCRALTPFWRDQAVTFSGVNPVSGVTVGGTAPIGDGVFVFSGTNGVQRLTHTTTGDYIELDTNTTTNAVTVDCGQKTIKQLGAHLDGVDDIPEPWFIELRPGSNAFTLSGGGSCTFTGRDQYL